MEILYFIFGIVVLAVPLAIAALIIFAIYHIIKAAGSTKVNDQDIIDRLNAYKAQGLKTIDQVIDFIKSEAQPTKDLAQKEKGIKSTIEKETPPLPTTTTPTQKSNSNLILYLGSFLVTFSMLALVTLGWNTISDSLKVFLLTVNLLGFFIAGVLFIKDEKLKRVAKTFLTVSSIGYFLLTLGIWNFILIKDIPTYFNLYWFITSIIGLFLNLVIMKLINEKRFFYLLLFSIYSIIFSSTFTITSDIKTRVLMIIVMNFMLYLSSSVFGENNKQITTISNIVNFIGNFIIFFIVLNLVPSIKSTTDILIAILSLALPSLYIVTGYIREKASFYLGFEMLLLVFKIMIVLKLLKILPDYNLIILSLTFFVYAFIGFQVFSQKSKGLYYLSLFISYLMIFFITLVGLTSIFSYQINDLSTFAICLSLLIAQLTLLFIPVLKKNYLGIGIAGLYFIVILFVSVKITLVHAEITNYLYTLLGFGIITGLAEDLFGKTNTQQLRAMFSPASIISLFITIVMTAFTVSLETMTIASTILTTYTFYKGFKTNNTGYLVLGTLLLNLTLIYSLHYFRTGINTEYVIIGLTLCNSLLGLTRFIKISNTKVINVITRTSLTINLFILLITPLFLNVLGNNLTVISYAYIFIFASMIIQPNKLLRKLSGIPILFALWNLFSINNLSFQYSVAVLTAYLLILAYIQYREKAKTSAKTLEIFAYILEFSSLLLHSMIASNDEEKVIIGVILIILSSILFLFGVSSNRKYIWIISAVYLLLELFIQFLFIIILIPWWLYLVIIGLLFISIAIYQIKSR